MGTLLGSGEGENIKSVWFIGWIALNWVAVSLEVVVVFCKCLENRQFDSDVCHVCSTS